jgi:hypothetical protein
VKYTKITLEIVVLDDDYEPFIQALDNALEDIEEKITVYSSETTTAAADEPKNAAEIGAPR